MPHFRELRKEAEKHPIEEVGSKLRALMPWLRLESPRRPVAELRRGRGARPASPAKAGRSSACVGGGARRASALRRRGGRAPGGARAARCSASASALNFFRDPERVAPAGRPPRRLARRRQGASPCVAVRERALPATRRRRASASSCRRSNVHVNRSPVDGTRRGGAAHARASSAPPSPTRRRSTTSGTRWCSRAAGGASSFVQIAGALARRIVCRVRPGRRASQRGERFGMIMFGSRVDLFLPPDVRPTVQLGRPRPGRRDRRRRGARREEPPASSVVPGRGRRRIPPLRKGVYLLPNLFTTGGLFAGFYSIIATLDGDYRLAAIMHPGRARLRRARRPDRAAHARRPARFGIEYDSLADLVAFGVAPGILVYTLGARAVGPLGLARGVALRHLRRAPAGALQRAGRARSRSGTSSACRSPPRPT